MLKIVFCFTVATILFSGALPMARAADRQPSNRDDVGSIEVEMTGIVRSGVMAIGGESTGTTITALGFTWELDLQGNKEFAELAEKWNGKEIVVKGTVTVKQGVERGRRVIILVKKMMPLTK